MPAAASDDAVFVGQPSEAWRQGDPEVVAISPEDGAIRWRVSDFADPSIGLFALSLKDGAVLWTVASLPALLAPAYANGAVYLGVGDPATVVAVDATTGQQLWSHALDGDNQWDGISSPSIQGPSRFVSTRSGAVFAFDRATGDLQWQSQIYSDVGATSVPPATSLFAIGNQGFLPGHDAIYAIDLEDGSLEWTLHPSSGDAMGMATIDGMLYDVIRSESDERGRLLAFAEPPRAP